MPENSVTTKLKLWQWNEMKGSWYFVTLNKTAEAWLNTIKPKVRRGWGSVPVTVTIGSTTWQTSVFPDKTRGWVMPVKAKVRKAEGLVEGKLFTITLKRGRMIRSL